MTESDWDDYPLPEDKEIEAAHPLHTGRHDLYAEAMRLVGAKRSKGALVELVNWLLYKNVRRDNNDQEYLEKCTDAFLARKHQGREQLLLLLQQVHDDGKWAGSKQEKQ